MKEAKDEEMMGYERKKVGRKGRRQGRKSR